MTEAIGGVDVARVSKLYGDRVVLNDVTFTVRMGGALAVVGPAGAGKTTLARILATAEAPTRGVVRIMGFHTRRRPLEARARLGYLPATAGLDPDLTVEEYLEFFLRAYDRDDEGGAAAMADVLELADLGTRRDAPVRELNPSDGRKLSLARCLLHDPDVLILDEPMAELDPAGQREVRAVLQTLREMGKTLVLCTRSVRAVAGLATDFCLLDHGIACEVASEEELRRWHTPHVLADVQVRGDLRQAARVVAASGALPLLRERARYRLAFESPEQVRALEEALSAAGIASRVQTVAPELEDVFAACYARRAQVTRQAERLVAETEA